jgi:hypothetical protein
VGGACAIYLGTYVAAMVEVAVNRSTGRVENPEAPASGCGSCQ